MTAMSIPRSLHPVDVVLASTRLYASLPVVGRHLEPFAGLTAMALWGGHYAPAAIRAAVGRRFGEPTAPAEVVAVPSSPAPSRVPPYLRARAQKRKCLFHSSIRYGN